MMASDGPRWIQSIKQRKRTIETQVPEFVSLVEYLNFKQFTIAKFEEGLVHCSCSLRMRMRTSFLLTYVASPAQTSFTR